MSDTVESAPARGWWQRHWQDTACIASIVGMAMAYLSPAVKDGWSFGPYDSGANGTIGHTGSPSLAAVYNRINGDLINQGIPWNTLDRALVLAGHLPLWNSYNMLGLPEMFNFESAAFSAPDLLSYAVPIRAAWLVIAFAKLLIAGTGAYVLCRKLGTRPLSATFGGISFMLSGGFASWLGWSLSGVAAWAPWICALILCAYRDPRRRWPVLLALCVMFAFFGGFPEMYALLAGGLLAFVVFGAAGLVLTRRRASVAGSARALAGLVGGVALASPLLLPGAQLLRLSTHAAGHGKEPGMSVSFLSLMVAPGYYGLPIRGSTTFPGISFYETVSYIGVIAIALALVGLLVARRQAAVAGMAGLTLVCFVSTFRIGGSDVAGSLLVAVGLGSVHVTRIRLVTGLGISVLAAVGLDQILHRPRASTRVIWLVASLIGAGLVVALVLASAAEHLRGYEATERFHSLIWPCALAAVLVGSVAALLIGGRHNRQLRARWRRPIGLGLVGAQAAFLLFAGVGLNSYSPTGTKTYQGAAQLESIVGSQLVGLDGGSPASPQIWPRLGFYPNLNIAYHVAEFAAHDPILPATVAREFPVSPRSGHGRKSLSALNIPDITSASLARHYGISYLLVQPGRAIPSGTKLVATISGERLVRVGGAERFSFEDVSTTPAATVRSWSQPDDNLWLVHVSVPQAPAAARVLVLRLTDLPGFEVTDGGRQLSVRRYGHFEMAVTVPAGDSTVEIRYWPREFTDGLLIAGAAVVAMALWCVVPLLVRRRRRTLVSDPA
ncbi:MAG: hypothetical protein ACLPYW_06920 [Acidimicrobiales bacterium]